MRSAVVVEVDGKSHCGDDFFYVPEDPAFEQLVLYRVVDALSLGIVLWVAGLGHAHLYAVLPESVHVFAACVLAATVGVVDEVDIIAIYALQGHPQSLQMVAHVQGWADTPSNNLFTVGIEYQRQVAEVVVADSAQWVPLVAGK